ncbi:MAG: GEVED domain-containing protein, partial [Bacteroidota bacterium]
NPVSACYCTPSTTGGTTYYISNFTTTGGSSNINNASVGSATGYQDFFSTAGMSSLPNDVINYNMTVAGGSTYGRAIWVDWNQDGAFSAGEQVASSTGYLSSPLTGSFTVPLTALAGTTRMRIIASFTPSNPSNPCTNSGTGEYEDYAFTVIALTPCTTPAPGNTLASANPACSGVNFTLSLQNFTTGSGVTYKWQSSPDGTTWANVSGATSSTLITSQTVATYYQCLVTCSSGPNTTTSTQVYVTMAAVNACYCINTNTTSTTYYINNFSTTNGITNITNNNSGFSANGYGNFTGLSVSQVPGSSVSFSMSEVGGTMGFGIWVDWNQDGDFADAGEQMYLPGSYQASATGSFTVPAGALPGNTRMRVVGNELAVSPTACTGTAYTECEDYTFNVVGYPATPANPTEVGTPVCSTGGNIAAVGSAPSGETWYWQATAAGTSIATPVSGNYNIPANGTYYIRSRDNSTLLWSTGAGSIIVSDFPAGPAAPTISTPGGSSTCSVVNLVSSTAASGTTNYWQGTNSTGLSISQIADDGTTNTPLVVSTSGTYYLNSRDNSSSCWSVSSSQIAKVYGPVSGTATPTQITSCVNPTGLITANVSGAGTVVNNDFTSSTLPSYMTIQGSAVITAGKLQVTPSSGSQAGGVLIQNTTGLANNDFQVDFDFVTTASGGVGPADGLSYSFGDDVVIYPSATGDGAATCAPENGSGTKLKLSFDAINNTGGCPAGQSSGNQAGVYLMYNCTSIHQGGTTGTICPGVLYYANDVSWRATATTGATTHVTITINASGQVSMKLNNVTVVNNVQLPASYLTADKSTWKHAFAARTGGGWEGHYIDNLLIQFNNFYEYSINGGTSWSQTNPIIPPTSGTYSVDARYVSVPGCSANLGSVTINAPSFTTISTFTAICGTSSTTPDLSFTPSFGAGATYQWQSSPAGAGTWSNIGGATNTTYTAPAGSITSNTDFQCVISCGGIPIPGSPSSTATITVNPVPTVSASPTSNSVCSPGGTAAVLTATGSAATYAWLPVTGLTPSSGIGSPVSALPAGTTTYTVTATNSFGCTATSTASVTVVAGPVVTATATPNAVCPGSNVQLDATVLAGVTYDWSTNSTFITGATNIPDPVAVAVTSNQTYIVIATSTSSGCMNTQTVPVTVNAPPQPLASSNAPICETFQLALFGYNNASGQSTGNSWAWTGPGSYSAASQNPTISSATSTINSGTYYLTVTNNLGCTASASHEVAVNPNPVLTIASQTSVNCNGDMDGTVDIDATTGTPDYLYDLDFGNITLDGQYSGLAPGIHYADVTDNNGCVAPEITVTIAEPDVLTVSAGSNTPVCTGADLNLTSTPVGGTSGFTYVWTGPNGFTSTAANPTISAISTAGAGQYDLEITDAHGCVANTNHTVAINASPTAAASLSGSANKCLGQSATVQIAFTGTGPWTYTISGSGGPYSGTAPSSPANVNVTPTAAGTQTYTLTAVGNTSCPTGGTTSGSATVYVSTAPPATSAGQPVSPSNYACSGSVYLITTPAIAGQNIRYSWNT